CLEGSQSLSQCPDLVVHVQFHPKEKPYKCLECRQTFSHIHNLFYHQRVHTGERP
ncbi:ZN514 protein, partial [Cephalopterus ornatus]|nr:ZN514 protein [Cephalopterus ornatus]